MTQRGQNPAGRRLTRRQIRESQVHASRNSAGDGAWGGDDAAATAAAPQATGFGPAAPVSTALGGTGLDDAALDGPAAPAALARDTEPAPSARGTAPVAEAEPAALDRPAGPAAPAEAAAPGATAGADLGALPSRRELRGAAGRTSRRTSRKVDATGGSRRAGRRAEPARQGRPKRAAKPLAWLPRGAVLACLAAGTIAIPLSGVTTEDDQVRTPSAPVAAAEHSMLEQIDEAALRYDRETAGAASALLADTGAARRALVQTSRDLEREEIVCSDVNGEGANGMRAATASDPVVHPLPAGSFSQSSLYGERLHPIFGGYSMHYGTDFAAPLGTSIMAAADGVVRHAGEGIDGRSSMLVIIDHEIDGETFSSWYVHMYPDGVFVQEGEQVRAGQTIGAVGSNGNSTGPHLHLEIHLDDSGTTTDPGAFLADHSATLLDAEACS